MKPRALGNTQKAIRDEVLMLLSDNMKIVKAVLGCSQPDTAKLLQALGATSLNTFEAMQALKRMDTEDHTG